MKKIDVYLINMYYIELMRDECVYFIIYIYCVIEWNIIIKEE